MIESEDDLRARLEESLSRHKVPGASVAVVSGGRTTAVAAGVANIATGAAVTPKTVMHIGSITKVFNATLVMQLVQQGRVSLDDPVLSRIPDLRLKDRTALERITVRMLLNHTSGIDGELLPDHGHDEETIAGGIARFAELGQLFEPGTRFSYCNTATVIAGYLAQRITGVSWYDLVRARIFEPLSLQNAVTLPEEALLHSASIGHHLNSDGVLTRTSFAFLPLSFSPAGASLMMSARDLVEFARAHFTGGPLLSVVNAGAMRTATVDTRHDRYTFVDGMGLGWMLYDGGVLFHGGGGPGIVAALYASPSHEFAVAVLTNAAHGVAVINDIVEPLLPDIGVPRPFGTTSLSTPVHAATIDPGRFVGLYEDVMTRYRVARRDDGLEMTRQAKFACYDYSSTAERVVGRLMPLGGDEFLACDGSKPVSGNVDAGRIVTFLGSGTAGRPTHLGTNLRLHKRAS